MKRKAALDELGRKQETVFGASNTFHPAKRNFKDYFRAAVNPQNGTEAIIHF